ncbi:MAG: exodeoxyribonuclease V gamma subunit [Candidatus Azotimanducaceae bacterium]|jgi:exodeoxyribonuclease V gamma subunit
MLELLQSNRMQLLVETLCERLQQPDDPFEPTLVVVQSQGIGQWLKVELAQRLGIAANIECMLPAELIWRLYQRVLPNDLPDESPFSRQLMTWRLMQLLPESSESSIQQYLTAGADTQLRLYQLSHVIAGLFDQYLIYRPDWIYAWETGEADAESPWQSALWRELLQQPGMDPELHRANLHRLFLREMARDNTSQAKQIPKQINLLGLAALPAMHLETLQAVARQNQVCIYFLNPSEHYWGDIASEKDIAKKSIRQMIGKDGPLLEEDYLEVGNPLLSSTGKQGREFLELLLDTEGVATVDLFQDPGNNTVLSRIQSDLMNLEFGGEIYQSEGATPVLPRDRSDTSIQIHCTHGRMREVEVLLDQILAMIDQADPQQPLGPADIMVMAPDISIYAPYIQAVFQNKLPFSITDRPAIDQSAVLVAFNKLLLLPDSRLTATEVMDLLEIPTIAARFDLGEADITRLQYWIHEAGIRFEMDGKSKADRWSLPAEDYNTWRFGLDRLLLGLAMESAAGLYAQTAPFDVNPGDAELIGTLCHLVDLLAKHREILSEAHTAEKWQTAINSMLAELMVPTAEEEISLAQVNDALSSLVSQNRDTHFGEPITPRLFRHWLQEQLQQPPQNRGFVSGRVTFATLVPMRSIPYRSVCLLGMNDREFPREDKPLSFDLMAVDYRKGDRSRRNDDRYLFLESLLSAKEHLYISYIGRGQKDNKPKPPSELVSELMDYLQRIYGDNFVLDHPLQPFSSIYYEADSPIRSYSDQWYKAITDRTPHTPFIDAPLPPDADSQLEHIDQLSAFLRHPAKYFLNQRLGVYFRDDDNEMRDTESFALDGLDKYQLADSALQIQLSDQSIEEWQDYTRASGLVLPGPMGERQLQTELDLARLIAAAVTKVSADESFLAQFSILVSGIQLQADIALRGDQHIIARTGELRARQILDAWARHLALCANGYDSDTYLISRGSNRSAKTETFKNLDSAQAMLEIEQLTHLYQEGLSMPLRFLPQTAYDLATHKDQDLIAALDAAHNKFMKGGAGSERDDPYYNRLFDLPTELNETFAKLANQIWQPILVSMGKRQ